MRVLILTNMYPSSARPALGTFVRDQVEALRRLEGLEVELTAFEPPGGWRPYASFARALRRRFRGRRFDVVHAHYGLSGWPALAVPAASRLVTFHGDDLNLPGVGRLSRALVSLIDMPAPVSARLARSARGGRPVAGRPGPVPILPCGVDLERFRPIDRRTARHRLGLEPDGRYLLFPAGPRRPEKRHDRALALADAAAATLLTLGATESTDVPLYMNAANAVLVPSEREGFGLAVLEALACDVPVLSTPEGIAPLALAGVAGTLCAPFHREHWLAALEPHLDAAEPRVSGRARATIFGRDRMAERVALVYRTLAGPKPTSRLVFARGPRRRQPPLRGSHGPVATE